MNTLLLVLLAAAAASPAPVPTVASGRVERLAGFPSRFVAARHVDVWLPDGHPSAGRYDAVYVHDGQMLFDAAHTWNHQEWRVDEVAGELIARGRVRPFVVVGVWNGGEARHREYFPEKPFLSLSPGQRQALQALSRDGRPLLDGPVCSDDYLRFLTRELKPHVDRRFAVDPSREHTFVMGSSMGGLVSLYALTEHPDVFGGAACLSTHWPGTFTLEGNPVPDALLRYLSRRLPGPGRHRLYFDHGTEALDALYPGLQRRVDEVVRAKGYREDAWLTRVFPGADHSERAWAERLAVPLEFLLGTGRRR